MSTRGLSGLLDLGNSGLRAARAQMAVTGRNITNANTPGYTRQVQLQSSIPYDGVSVGGVLRGDDPRLLAREQDADSARAHADDLHAALEPVEAVLNQGDSTLVDAIAALFGGFAGLAAAPTSAPLRSDTVQKATSVATAFRAAAAAVERGRADADRDIAQVASDASRLAAALADINADTLGRDPDPAALDERERLSRELSKLVGGSSQVGEDGGMRFILDSGAVLVDGKYAAELRTTPDAANDGHLRMVMVSGNVTHDVSTNLTRGRVGGLLEARDRVLASAGERIDQLAFDLASNVNQIHAANQGLDGVSGRDLFATPTGVHGAAASFAVSADVLADPSALATAAAGGGLNDNRGALALADLRNARVAQGRTFTDASIDTLASFGTEVARASSALDAAEAHSDFLAGLRDARSGVSIEEEMSRLAEMQHAHAAATRFVQAVDETFADFLATI